MSSDTPLSRQSFLFLVGLDDPTPQGAAEIIRYCQATYLGGVLLEFPLILDRSHGLPYALPSLWTGGMKQAVEFVQALRKAGLAVGAQLPLHQPPGGYGNIKAHVAAIAARCNELDICDVIYADGAENASAWGPLHTTVDRVLDMFLSHLTVQPAVIQSSVGSLCSKENRGGQTDYLWHSADRMREIWRAVTKAAQYAEEHNVAGDGGWLTDTVPGGDGRLMPLSPIETQTAWALALGYDVALTLRTSQAGLREGEYTDAAVFPVWILEYLRQIDGGSDRWAFLRGSYQEDQYGWMYCPTSRLLVIAAYEVPYPARCHPGLHMCSGTTDGTRVVMVWADTPKTIEFDVTHSCPRARVLRVVDSRGHTVWQPPEPVGQVRLHVGPGPSWIVMNDVASRYELNVAMRFARVF